MKITTSTMAFKDWIKVSGNRIRLDKPCDLAKAKPLGHSRYFGEAFNQSKLEHFYWQATQALFKRLNRRSPRRSFSWSRIPKRRQYQPISWPPGGFELTGITNNSGSERNRKTDEPDAGEWQVRYCEKRQPRAGVCLMVDDVVKGTMCSVAQDYEAVEDWSDEDFRLLRPNLGSMEVDHVVRASESVKEAALRCGLLSESGTTLTPLGQRLKQLSLWESRQVDDEIHHLVRAFGGDCISGPILEVGCSSAHLLRTLQAPTDVERVGVDIDALALAFGRRCAEQDGKRCQLELHSADSMPYPDGHFRWVICRNAVTYMHQRRALGEMCRLLHKGGFLLVRYENVWYDLNKLTTRSSGLKSLVCNARDLAWGVVHATTGWQPIPGVNVVIVRSFCSPGRFRKMVERFGCRVLYSQGGLKCPTFLGHATQTSVLCRKE